MRVTAHFMSEDWQLHSFVLETKVLEESHTATNIKERLSEVMEEFKIPGEKRVAVVHDNAANMVLCTELISNDPSWGNAKGVRCAGHTLQLCINVALKTDPICRCIAAARRLVGHFKKSTKATTALTHKHGSRMLQNTNLSKMFPQDGTPRTSCWRDSCNRDGQLQLCCQTLKLPNGLNEV